MPIIVQVENRSTHAAEKELMCIVADNNLRIKGEPMYATTYTPENALLHRITAKCVWRDRSVLDVTRALNPETPSIQLIRLVCETCGYNKAFLDDLGCPVCAGDHVPEERASAFVEHLKVLAAREDLPPLVQERVSVIATDILPSDGQLSSEVLIRKAVHALMVLEDML